MQLVAYFHMFILRPFGRPGQELLVEYQVEVLFINFPVSTSTAKKGSKNGSGSCNTWESLVKATISQQQYRYQTNMKVTQQKNNFCCVYSLLILRPDLGSSRDSTSLVKAVPGVVKEFF